MLNKKPEKYVIVFAAGLFILTVLGGIFRIRWLIDAATIWFCLAFQLFLIWFSVILPKIQNQGLKDVSKRRLFWSRVVFWIFTSSIIFVIGYFEYRTIKDALHSMNL
jgi:hypothetical protein